MEIQDSTAAGLRALRVLWTVAFGGLATLAVAFAVAAQFRTTPPLVAAADSVFYVSAFANLGAIIWAFAVQHWTRLAVLRVGDPDERVAILYTLARRALVPLTATALFAVLGSDATGAWVQDLVLGPPLGFLALFFPTRSRTKSWLTATPTISGESK